MAGSAAGLLGGAPWVRAFMNDEDHGLDFSGKTVFVVGGSSGIGNAVARAFCNRGANVHVSGTRAHASDYSACDGSDLSGLSYTCLDLSKPGEIVSAGPQFDALDVLVLSQGMVLYKRQEFTPAGFRAVMDLNLNSLMECALAYRSALAQSDGALVTISSAGGRRTTRGNPAYAASKAGVIHLTATLAEAWAGEGIRVNGVAPGLVATKMTEVTTADPARLEERLKGIPLKRLGDVHEIANVVMFLASPLASYIVGQTIAADGGRTLS